MFAFQQKTLLTYAAVLGIGPSLHCFAAAPKNQSLTPREIRCELKQNCTSRLVDGLTIFTLTGGESEIQVSLTSLTRFTRAEVTVTNRSNADFDVQPSAFLLSPGGSAAFKAFPLAVVLKKEGRRDKTWGNFFDMGSMATKKETVVITDKSVGPGHVDQGKAHEVEMTVPDEEARQESRDRTGQRKELLTADLASMRDSYFRANTLSAGQSAHGMVYFDSSHPGDHFTLVLPVGACVYRFSLGAEALD